VGTDGGDGVLITGGYGSGKSSVAAEIAFALERRGEPYALLDLDYLSWAGAPDGGSRADEVSLMLTNLAAVVANYRRAGIGRFVLAYFIRTPSELQGIRQAVGVPVRVVRLIVPLDEIKRRLAGDVTSGRRDDLRAAAGSLAIAEGAGLEDMAIGNDRPVSVVAEHIMAFLSWAENHLCGHHGVVQSGHDRDDLVGQVAGNAQLVQRGVKVAGDEREVRAADSQAAVRPGNVRSPVALGTAQSLSQEGGQVPPVPLSHAAREERAELRIGEHPPVEDVDGSDHGRPPADRLVKADRLSFSRLKAEFAGKAAEFGCVEGHWSIPPMRAGPSVPRPRQHRRWGPRAASV